MQQPRVTTLTHPENDSFIDPPGHRAAKAALVDIERLSDLGLTSRAVAKVKCFALLAIANEIMKIIYGKNGSTGQ